MKYPSFPAKNDPEYKLHRILEMFPGVLTWTTLIGAVAASFFIPLFVAVLVILYDLYWLIKTVIISGHTFVAYRRMRSAVKQNWLKKCQEAGEYDGLNIRNIYHLIIIPYYKEGLEILEPSIKSITESNYPLDRVVISITCEERAGTEACSYQEKLKEKYGHLFRAFITNVHIISPGEMKIKACNANFAARRGVRYLEEEGVPVGNVIVSNFDCDTVVHRQYLAATTYQFLVSPKRYRQSYQPLPMYNNNIWDTIAIVRVIEISSSFWHMVESTRPERLVTFSSHSMSLRSLIDVGYWQNDVISDDSAIFFQSYIYYDGDYRTVPLYIPVSMDATLSTSFFKTIANQYKQKRRWAYGIESFPRVARAFLKNDKIPLGDKIRHLGIMIEGHFSWATASFLIMMLGWLPLVIGGTRFNETVIAHNLPVITRNILTLAMLGLAISLFLSFFLLPPKPKKYSRAKYLIMFFQWFLVPFIAPFMGSLPAIDAQTRLMLGKYFQASWVSEKVRKE